MGSNSRNLRLENDYRELSGMCGDLLSLRVLKGSVPYIEEYELTIHARSPISTVPTFRNIHVVKIKLPPSYPQGKPAITMESSPKIAHPNWYRDGRWCEGSYDLRESLGTVVRRMIATIQFNPDYANPESPADTSVLDWYNKQVKLGMLPYDKQILPDPKGQKTTNMKKLFKIKR